MLNNKLFLIIALVSLPCLSNAQSQLTITGGPSLSFSDLKWSIAGDINGRNPTVLSELSYKKVKRVGFCVAADYKFKDLFTLSATVAQSFTIDGIDTDVDYQGNYRTNPSSALNFKSKRGNAVNATLTASIKARDYGFAKVFVGIQTSALSQKLYMESPEMAALASSYTATSLGAGPTIRLQFNMTKKMQLDFNETFERNAYRAKGNWHINPNFQSPLSFKQCANGFSFNTGFAFHYRLTDRLSLLYRLNYVFEKINKGRDTAYLSNDQTSQTQFNGASQKLIKLNIGLKYAFGTKN